MIGTPSLPRFGLGDTGSAFDHLPLYMPLPVLPIFPVESLQFADSKARESGSGNGCSCPQAIDHFDVSERIRK